jgi:hypothetical protein
MHRGQHSEIPSANLICIPCSCHTQIYSSSIFIVERIDIKQMRIFALLINTDMRTFCLKNQKGKFTGTRDRDDFPGRDRTQHIRIVAEPGYHAFWLFNSINPLCTEYTDLYRYLQSCCTLHIFHIPSPTHYARHARRLLAHSRSIICVGVVRLWRVLYMGPSVHLP